ncbi:thiamine-phosphate synthase family protein [Marinitoga sp. 38H-ov]|uniref:thiamine-phosphate synthase family protein n=1 Tax=Marinitoga sp. 38H-ov TaxID=1755814 RepID=UPI0013EB8217|nr:thiamine-phosphate synthase family protein [Marinitoga sp. 38H-ov]KAF2955237.1 hypothetical protein AS160_01680 [Marinitoga sp. 38H-ov]
MLIFSGFDPSGGAGILQDITIMKLFKINPKAIISAYTIQNENICKNIEFRDNFEEFKLFDNFSTIKVGMANAKQLKLLRNKYNNAKIIWNPVIKTSSGYEAISPEEVIEGAKYADLVIMNSKEYELTKIEKNVIITGGHKNLDNIEVLYNNNKFYSKKYDKDIHGTGCVFSSLISAHIYMNYTVEESIKSSLYYMDNLVNISKEHLETETLAYNFHKSYILEELWHVKNKIIELGKYTIPEVGQNIVFALPNAQNEFEVGKFPGRIHKLGDEVNFIHEPGFFGKSHMARAVIATMKYFPWIRSAMNIKYEKKYIEKAKEKGYKTFYLDRNQEPVEIQTKEGHSIPYGLSNIYDITKEPIDFVWDDGFYGKEAMIRVFGRNPQEVIEKVKDVVLSD